MMSICLVCGKQWSKKTHGRNAGKYCSIKCANQKRKTKSKIQCKTCSGQASADSRSGDCRRCVNTKRNQRNGAIANATCRHCKKIFKPRASAHSTYCSRECAFENKKSDKKGHPIAEAMKKMMLSKVWSWHGCVGCGSLLLGHATKCRGCKLRDNRIKESIRNPRKHVLCVGCGVLLGNQIKRCSSCKKEKQREARRKSKVEVRHRTRARKHQNEYVPFRRNSVFERDKYKCHICLGPCMPPTKKYHPMAATIDHVVALANGGSHTIDNAATAHWICNSYKSDR